MILYLFHLIFKILFFFQVLYIWTLKIIIDMHSVWTVFFLPAPLLSSLCGSGAESKKQTKKKPNNNKSVVYLTFYFNATFRKVSSCIFNRVFLQLMVRTRLYSDCLNFAQWQPVSWVSFHILEPQTQEGHAINIFKMLHEVQKYIYQRKLQVSSCLQTVITSSVPKRRIGS